MLTTGQPLPNLYIYVGTIASVVTLRIALGLALGVERMGVPRTLPAAVLAVSAVSIIYATGSAFALGMLQRLDPSDTHPVAVTTKQPLPGLALQADGTYGDLYLVFRDADTWIFASRLQGDRRVWFVPQAEIAGVVQGYRAP